MFRIAIFVLAGIGLGALLFGGVGGAAAGIGLLALFPLLILLKVAFIAVIFGVFSGGRSYRGRWPGADFRPPWRSGRSESSEERETSATDRFEEWHRMAHAREEVAGWADEPE